MSEFYTKNTWFGGAIVRSIWDGRVGYRIDNQPLPSRSHAWAVSRRLMSAATRDCESTGLSELSDTGRVVALAFMKRDESRAGAGERRRKPPINHSESGPCALDVKGARSSLAG